MDIETYVMDTAPSEIRTLADRFATKYQAEFETLTYFPKTKLDEMLGVTDHSLPHDFVIASEENKILVELIDGLTRIANMSDLSLSDHKQYLENLLEIYRACKSDVFEIANDSKTLVVAPEREGRIIAECLGLLPQGRCWRPHAKRIPYEGGLLVALQENPLKDKQFERCLIIDGAIASGSTLMATISSLSSSIASFTVVSAHCTRGSLGCLAKFASQLSSSLSVEVGHASGFLNQKYYAEMSETDNRVVIGDIGDMISAAV